METLIQYLDVKVEFEPRRISIGFDKQKQAVGYYEAINRTKFSREMDLDIKQRGNYVSVRLPSRVSEIVASTSALGFYLVFSDEELAAQWRANLLLWDFISNSKRKLYVRRGLSNETLNVMFGIEDRAEIHEERRRARTPRERSPGRAKNSRVS
jgi:hypothetical protein